VRPTVPAVALILAGCAAAAPPDAPEAPVTLRLPADPAFVLAALRETVLARGLRIADETADSIEVDLGVAPCTVALPGEAAGPRRATEVHASARYLVCGDRDAPHVALVTLVPANAWWHPDRRAWLALPPDRGPGLELLTVAAGLP
jgi:hypothetical protein